MDSAWSFEHSCECSVSMEFAWRFWCDVRNWALDADILSVHTDGPLAAGTHGVTHSKSSGRIEWRIADMEPGRAVVEIPWQGSTARYILTFQDAGGHARMVQRVELAGPDAASFGPVLESSIPAGMARLCEAMEQALRAS